MRSLVVIGLFMFIADGCIAQFPEMHLLPCPSTEVPIHSNPTKSAELEKLLVELTQSGVPGVSLALHSDEGWWTGSAGYARIEDQILMENCHLQYLQSISKIYMAVTILKLFEEGRIDLDRSITQYLPNKISNVVSDAQKITVRMLLNHTSGVPEYNSDTEYITELLQHPDHEFYPEDYLKYIDGKKLSFEPGSKFSYRNTNYVLLASIGDYVTGNHAKYMSEIIVESLGLNNTYYRGSPGYLEYPNLVNSYWDRYGNSVLENATYLQRQNVRMLTGDDGIVSTPMDVVKFLKGLMEGRVLSSATLMEMKTWVPDSSGNPTYGLGLDYISKNGLIAYGHGGAGIGAGAELLYFPEKNIYVFVGINLGVVTESPIHQSAEKILTKIYDVVLK